MATIEQLSAALVRADKAGDAAGAKALAAELRRVSASAAPQYDPSAGGNALKVLNPFGQDFNTGIDIGETTTRALAGAGKAFADTGRGVGQYLGLTSRDDVAASRQRDAPLMQTGAGQAGNFGANVAIAAPTMFIPGAATIPGAAAVGAAQGLVQPSVSTGETLGNAALGGAAGAGGVAAVRAIKGLYQGGKALAEPFTQAGREKIAGRMIDRFAANPATVAGTSSAPTATGALPTLAEQTGDAGLARLQDSLRSVDPQIGNQIGQRLRDNNAARVGALQGLAGTSAQRDAASAARTVATKPLYDAALAQKIDVTPELKDLLKRPSTQKALARAANIASEEGRVFGLTKGTPAVPGQQILDANGNVLLDLGTAATPGKVTGQTLQDIKMAMDALLKDPTSGIAGEEARLIKSTRDAIVRSMEGSIPEFNGARTGYARLSQPLNAMDIGEHVARKATSNTSDLAGNQRMQANALLGMLRDEEGLIKQATGRKGLGNKLSNILTPEQENILRSVASETDRAAAVASDGNGPGSATAQRMASQNVLRQIVGPTGLPSSWAESVIANTAIGKPLNLLYGGVAEPKIQQALARAVLDPEYAKLVQEAARQAGPRAPSQNALIRALVSAARVTPSTAATTQNGE